MMDSPNARKSSQIAPASPTSQQGDVETGSSTSSDSSKPSKPLIQRYYKQACLLAWFVFLTYEVLLGLNSRSVLASSVPLCTFDTKNFASWYQKVVFGVLGAFAALFLCLLFRITIIGSDKARKPALVLSLTSVGISLATTLASAIWNHGGTCVDQLGVATSAALWGEWGSCGPLLLFIPLALVDKLALSRADIFLLTSFFVSVASTFVIIIPQPYQSAVFFLTLSALALAPVLALPFFYMTSRSQPPTVIGSSLLDIDDDDSQIQRSNVARRHVLSAWLSFAFSLFALNYLISVYKLISIELTLAAFHVLSVLTNGLFVAVALDLVGGKPGETSNASLERNNLYGSFLGYIHNDIRVPVKNLNKAIDKISSLGGSSSPSKDKEDSIASLLRTTEFLAQTLRVVSSMRKLDDNTLSLQRDDICVETVVRRAVTASTELARSKGLTVDVDVVQYFPGLPASVTGDGNLLEHVVFLLLSSAIKRTSEKRNVNVHVICEKTVMALDGKGLEATITITVEHEASQDAIASDPSLPEQALYNFSRHVIAMHRGVLAIRKNFSNHKAVFTIPFPVVAGATVKKAYSPDDAPMTSFGTAGLGLGFDESLSPTAPNTPIAPLPVFNLTTMQFEPVVPVPAAVPDPAVALQSPSSSLRKSFVVQMPTRQGSLLQSPLAGLTLPTISSSSPFSTEVDYLNPDNVVEAQKKARQPSLSYINW